MLYNVLSETRYIAEIVNDETGKHYTLHMIRNEDAPVEGFIAYEFYISDQNPEHDILIGIGRKAFADDEYATEDKRLEELKDILDRALSENWDRVDRLLDQSV